MKNLYKFQRIPISGYVRVADKQLVRADITTLYTDFFKRRCKNNFSVTEVPRLQMSF